MFKYNLIILKEYILIFLTATIFFLQLLTGLHAKENIFIIKDIKIEGSFDVNFSRDKFIDKAFKISFKKLLSNILLLDDQDKLNKMSLNEISNLVYGTRILSEKFKNNKYLAVYEIEYDDSKIKKLLRKKNISFFVPTKTKVIFLPILFEENEIKIFNNNPFYKSWLVDKPLKEKINFILPIENIDDISLINKAKYEIESVDFKRIAIKYNLNNYVVAIMNHKSDQLKVYLKTEFESKKYDENILYELKSFDDTEKLNFIISDLKLKIMDIWKRANLINIPLPLNINIHFKYKKLEEINKLEKVLKEINIINKYSLEEFDIDHSLFLINYYGEPKKLNEEFFRHNYRLIDNQGYWELVKR